MKSFIFILLATLPLAAQLREIETKDLRLIFYDPRHTYLAPQLMRSFERSFAFHKQIFNYQPKEKVSILLEDFSDFSHGGADAIPLNRVNVGIAPASYIYETVPTNERMSWMMNHELAHVAELDGSRRLDRNFRKLFGLGTMPGKIVPDGEDPLSMAYAYLTVPRRYAPRWYHEGIAVFLETWMSGGLGRSLGGYDEMVFRSLVRDNARIYDLVGLEAEGTTIDFQVGVNSYLYGTRFITWLGAEYGPEKILAWARSGDDSKTYFSSQFQKVYGESLSVVWRRWIEAEKAWQQQNLTDLRKYPITPLTRISKQPLGSVSNPFFDEQTNQLLVAVRYPGPMAHLAAINPQTGQSKNLRNIYGSALFFVTSLAFDKAGRKVFFTTENNDQRDLNVHDLTTGKHTRLFNQLRAGDLAFDPQSKSLWAIRHNNGLSSVIEIPPPYNKPVTRFEFPYGTDPFDLDISPDGKLMAAVISDSSGRQRLVTFELERLRNNDATTTLIKDFDFASAASFTFSPDGQHLYGTSFYSGASNIFRFDLANKTMEALTNTETGLFWPRKLADGRLLAFEYTAQGFYPVLVQDAKPLDDITAVKYLGQQVVQKFPQVKSWNMGPAREINLAEVTTRAGTFRPISKLRPHALFPIVQGYKDQIAYGGRLDLSDGLGLARLKLTATFSPTQVLPLRERGHASAELNYFGWRATVSFNQADFYDLFGPTKTARKGFAGLLGHKKFLRYKTSESLELDSNVAGYAGLDRLPEFQNIRASFDKFLTARVGLNYARVVKTLGAVDDEKGTKWKLITRTNLVNGNLYPRFYGQFDQGFLTPIRNSPVWVRSSAGKSFGPLTEPFANFFFGGFGNNYIDHQEISRYREYYSFAGVKLNQIGATDYAKSMVEWNLPPKRFRDFGTTALYCNWARLTVFSGFLAGNLTSSPNRQIYTNIGTQLDVKMVIASYLNTTFSVGFAGARDRSGRTSNELMLSLKLQ